MASPVRLGKRPLSHVLRYRLGLSLSRMSNVTKTNIAINMKYES